MREMKLLLRTSNYCTVYSWILALMSLPGRLPVCSYVFPFEDFRVESHGDMCLNATQSEIGSFHIQDMS